MSENRGAPALGRHMHRRGSLGTQKLTPSLIPATSVPAGLVAMERVSRVFKEPLPLSSAQTVNLLSASAGLDPLRGRLTLTVGCAGLGGRCQTTGLALGRRAQQGGRGPY